MIRFGDTTSRRVWVIKFNLQRVFVVDTNESVRQENNNNKTDPLFQKLVDEFGVGAVFFLASLAAKTMEEDRQKKENNLPEK